MTTRKSRRDDGWQTYSKPAHGNIHVDFTATLARHITCCRLTYSLPEAGFYVRRSIASAFNVASKPTMGMPCTLAVGAAGGHFHENNHADNGDKHNMTPSKGDGEEDGPSASGAGDLTFLPGIRPLRAKQKTGAPGAESAPTKQPVAPLCMTASRLVGNAHGNARPNLLFMYQVLTTVLIRRPIKGMSLISLRASSQIVLCWLGRRGTGSDLALDVCLW